MVRTRLFPLIIVLTLAIAACTPQQPAGSATITQIPVIPSATLPPPTATDTSAPSPTATSAPLPTSTPLPTATTVATTPTVTPATTVATATIVAPGTTVTPGTTVAGSPSNPLDCASFNNPDVKITVPDGVGPYKIFCAGGYGGLGVEIAALGADNKMAAKATFANPVKVCFKGRGKVAYMDIFGGSFTSTNLSTTQEDAFVCAQVTKPGSVMLTP